MKRRWFAVGLILSLLWNAAPARADIYNGACALRLDFTFSRPIFSNTKPNPNRSVMTYTVDISGAADLDPSQTGMQACTVTNFPLTLFKRTFGSGSGQAILWNCDVASGFGTWYQDWEPATSAVFGTHTIGGTWGNWAIVVVNESLQFTGTINLTASPSDAAKLATQCRTTGITSLSMTGVMHFQDPSVPASR